MDKFKNIKTLCSYFSQCDAIECAQKTGTKMLLKALKLVIPLENIHKIAEVTKERGFFVDSGMVKIDHRGEDGGLIKGLGFDFKIFKEAYYLFLFVSHLDKSFNLRAENNKMFINYSDATFPPIIKKAAYFIGGNETWYVNIDSPMPTLKSSISPAGGICNSKELSVGLSIEFKLTFWPVIHELIHLKWPKGIPSTEEDVDRVTREVIKNIKPMLVSMKKIKERKKLFDKELKRISREFESFDREVGRILGIQ